MSVNRLMVTNRIQAAVTELRVSASAPSSPYTWLKDQLRSKTWRSPVGWTITAGNRGIDFNTGVDLLAVVAVGTYTTAAQMCTAIVNALEAADATPVWGCTYDTGTHKFTISGGTSSFSLKFGTGPNKAASIHLDLGFTSTDKGSATSHTAENAAYQSRHVLASKLESALGVTTVIVINHSAGTGGTFRFDFATTWVDSNTYGYEGTVSATQTLSGDANIRIASFSELTYQYNRLVINDVQNPLGYSEVGILYAGPHVETPQGFSSGWGKSLQPQNELSFAISGAHFVDQRPTRPVWKNLKWPGLTTAQRDALMAVFAVVPQGICFFFTFDISTPTSTEYVILGEEAGYDHIEGPNAFTINGPVLLGALG